MECWGPNSSVRRLIGLVKALPPESALRRVTAGPDQWWTSELELQARQVDALRQLVGLQAASLLRGTAKNKQAEARSKVQKMLDDSPRVVRPQTSRSAEPVTPAGIEGWVARMPGSVMTGGGGDV